MLNFETMEDTIFVVTLAVTMERSIGQLGMGCNILTGFVNHQGLAFKISLSEGVFVS